MDSDVCGGVVEYCVDSPDDQALAAAAACSRCTQSTCTGSVVGVCGGSGNYSSGMALDAAGCQIQFKYFGEPEICVAGGRTTAFAMGQLASMCASVTVVEGRFRPTICNQDNDCWDPNAVCNPATNRCIRCYEDSHCQGESAGLSCDPALSICVHCGQRNDCTRVSASRCDPLIRQCSACLTKEDCANIIFGSNTCVEGVCLQCGEDGDCARFGDEYYCLGETCLPLQ